MPRHANAIAIILGGGKGTRLYPLTKERSKPAVPFGGKYRLVDIPISNCINNHLRQIYVLTQFNSASLHNHIASTYVFDAFNKGFVEILAAEQTFSSTSWYQGTADAVRKNLKHFSDMEPDYCVILSGDQLYRMDLEKMLQRHVTTGAELTIAAKPISRAQCTGLGVIGTDAEGNITRFCEKPAPDADITGLKVNPDYLHDSLGVEPDSSNEYLASMGIYVFNYKSMCEMLDNDKSDFGKEIIPSALGQRKMTTFLFDGFWEDIGTIKAFYDTNLDLGSDKPQFNFYDETMPIYTHRRHLPATKISHCEIRHSLTSEGSIITDSKLNNSIIGVRSRIEAGTELDGVYCMGAGFYETEEQLAKNREAGIPDVGIGEGTKIRRAIIDQNARIGRNCRIGVDDIPRSEGDFDGYSIHDGIIVIHKGATIPDGTVM